jgi:hypothetical protein
MTDVTLLNSQYFNTPDNVGPVVLDAGMQNTTLNVTLTVDYLPPPPDPTNNVIYVYLLISPQRGPDRPYRDDLQYWAGSGTVSFAWQNVPAGTWYIDCHCYYSKQATDVPGANPPPEGDGLSVPGVTGRITVVASA